MSHFYGDAIFWIEVDKVKPNPYQPRQEFNDATLNDLAESIRTYGVLQPLVVTRKEVQKPEGGLAVEYELISGERRLRASKIAGVTQVPAIIRTDSNDSKVKLELAIIENLQREDLNPVDRAKAFQKLAEEFSYKHSEIAEKIGKSREYVSNTLRILLLPEEVLLALASRKISEGHTRPILMLADRPEEQLTLYKEIIINKMTVREAEGVARRIAVERVRKKDRSFDPEMTEIEVKLSETLGTRVQIERKEQGGKIHIDFFSPEDLQTIVALLEERRIAQRAAPAAVKLVDAIQPPIDAVVPPGAVNEIITISESVPVDDSSSDDSEGGDDLYSIKNFSL
ncbi:MAG: hypothetical protein A3C06_00875 [Candidatus Taylorbacteria bacterium RIFCSPHIGHO2_02_FULL_46_13]|uniref:ParB-like N-terminal domain-containing protein n=1 Tax=Candidatus Taylorbacteria bacterium RIFCSPHIGHO2_02_FULL_46_13 TaxID=1802312 RepID=A0A1G2MQG9_9BACT|nr:MAG: hypothetical protein A3C06_00875 [Candidatus Taylorbacteria bacterium RIFCSPHIGHO2_02_FULL_46_13]